ncbi:unnamed protein product [Parascedosporium putredinis]|uniref:Conidiation-specific protein 6 n=1 Tax=Parascedosporium putredinis TaxID=1442378 RepID=A0A9P1M986_9PEZI|nr:unnamed protein product [Parascedosporium putredinis]CAI7994184.1 unnamed protein product [Parascedosporium putredinis]
MDDRSNQARGHKATLTNPRVSEDAKQHSRDILDDEFDDDTTYSDKLPENTEGKNPGNVAGGLKAAVNNPNVSSGAKKDAQDRLDAM